MNTLNTAELGRSLIACVDSDYDFLLQGATNTSRKINRNRYIFQTYTYAIENYHCFAESLHEVCVQATLNDRSILDFNFFLKTVLRNCISAFPLERMVLSPTGYLYFPHVRFPYLYFFARD